jgi:hypothetical protein
MNHNTIFNQFIANTHLNEVNATHLNQQYFYQIQNENFQNYNLLYPINQSTQYNNISELNHTNTSNTHNQNINYSINNQIYHNNNHNYIIHNTYPQNYIQHETFINTYSQQFYINYENQTSTQQHQTSFETTSNNNMFNHFSHSPINNQFEITNNTISHTSNNNNNILIHPPTDNEFQTINKPNNKNKLSFNNSTNNTNKFFTINHWNCQFIKNKVNEIIDHLNIIQPTILCINEVGTKNDKLLNEWFHDIKYQRVQKLRSKKKGGGVLIFIKDGIQFEEIKITSNEEIIGIKLNLNNNMKIHIFSYYNAPHKKIDENLITNIYKNYKNTLILGDLNAHLTTFGAHKNNINGNILESILDKTNLVIINNNKKTYCKLYKSRRNNIIYKYEQTLDYILATPDIANKLIDFNISEDSILQSDHFLLECQFNLLQNNINNNSQPINKNNDEKEINDKYLYNFDLTNWEFFQETLDNLVDNKNETNININSMPIDEFENIILNIYNEATEKVIPKIKINKIGDISKSYLPKYLVNLRKIRNKNQKAYKKTKTLLSRTKYYESKYKFLKELENFKSNQWNKFMRDLGNKQPLSTKAFWRRIARIRSNKKSNKIPTLNDNNILLDTDEKKANYFKTKLGNTFKDGGEYCTTFNMEHKTFIEQWKTNFINNMFEQRNNNNFINNIQKITIQEVKQAIKNINAKNSVDTNNISNKLLKNASTQMQFLLQTLFNRILIENKYPENWKKSMITMIPKKGDLCNPKNYRPISITSSILRLFEKIIHKRMEIFVENNNLISKFQSGFRQHRQTKDNLLFLCQKTMENFNFNKKVCTIFYDIASAFDKVWLDGLLFKLEQLKLPIYLIHLMNTHLYNRTFQIKVNEHITPSTNIECGLQQGGVLSPLLFSIYINDLPINDSVDKHSLLFADDLAEMHILDEINETNTNTINAHLKKLENWLNKWRLKMAPEKCSYLIFSKNKKTGYNEKIDLNFYNELIPLESSNNVRFLGIRFDKHFSFKNQISYLEDTCLDRINVLKVLSHHSWKINKETLINIYKSLIRSIIDYSIYLYDVLSDTNKQMLQRIQNKSIRVIFNIKWDDKITVEQLHQMANLETIEQRANIINNNYLTNNTFNKNQLLEKLINEFELFKEISDGRKHVTLLDKWLNNDINTEIYQEDIELNNFFGD